jgi:pseudo-rSAM protein
LISRKNLYVIEMTEKDLQDKRVEQFILELRTHFMGDLIDQSLVNGKPIQIPADIKLMKKAEKHPDGSFEYKDNYQLTNLYELTVFLNQSINVETPGGYPLDAYRQFISPCFTGDRIKKKEISTRKNDGDFLPLPTLLNFIDEAENSLLHRLNISGGNIFDYPQLAELIDALKSNPADKVFYLHYTHLRSNNLVSLQKLGLTGSGNQLHVMVNFPVQIEKFEYCLNTLQDCSTNIQHEFQFIVTNMDEFEQADQLINAFGINNIKYVPFFNGHNFDFFKQAVFIDREDIFQEKSDMRKIQVRGEVNPLHYGHLTILNNGHIHANIYEPKIGKLGNDSLYDVLDKALYKRKSWRRIRAKVKPCNQCVFQMMCPPISNYEYALGRYNLCHVKYS